jgi:hypothetical protein
VGNGRGGRDAPTHVPGLLQAAYGRGAQLNTSIDCAR